MIVSYLGPRKTYSEEAAEMAAAELGGAELAPKKSLEDVALSILDRSADIAVMAYYNVIEGIIEETMPLIAGNRLSIFGVKELKIVLNLGAYPGSRDFSRIYSHPKALGQCSEYLAKNYHSAERRSVASTAAGIERVMLEMRGLALGRRDALEGNGMYLVAEDIGNRMNGRVNTTYFFVVRR